MFLRPVDGKFGADLGHLQAAQECVHITGAPAHARSHSQLFTAHVCSPSTNEEDSAAGINSQRHYKKRSARPEAVTTPITTFVAALDDRPTEAGHSDANSGQNGQNESGILAHDIEIQCSPGPQGDQGGRLHG